MHSTMLTPEIVLWYIHFANREVSHWVGVMLQVEGWIVKKAKVISPLISMLLVSGVGASNMWLSAAPGYVSKPSPCPEQVLSSSYGAQCS